MKTRFHKICLVIGLVLVPLGLAAQGFFADSDGNLVRAHEAYLAGDLRTMADSLHKSLEDHPGDTTVRDNALALLEKAYETADGGDIPVNWRLPEEITTMRVSVKYSARNSGEYNFRVYGTTVHDKAIAQLQVVQAPDRVVLDKQAGIGEWYDQSKIDTLDHVFELQSRKSRVPVEAGLYLLNVTLADGTQTKGWFLLDAGVNSSATPRVDVPSTDQVFTTGNPQFSWQDFKSPQYQPYEGRSIWVGVSRAEPPNYDWDEVWGSFEAPPTQEQITIDSHGDPGSLPKLNNGHYSFFIDFHERKKFGDLTISRDSITVRNFQVAQ